MKLLFISSYKVREMQNSSEVFKSKKSLKRKDETQFGKKIWILQQIKSTNMCLHYLTTNSRENGLENWTRLFRNLKTLFLTLITYIFIESTSKTAYSYSARRDLSIGA